VLPSAREHDSSRAVTASESRNELYAICEGAGPNTLVLVERYVDAEALEAHRTSDHMKTIAGLDGLSCGMNISIA
jgi:quinol monooxygenase YgiN